MIERIVTMTKNKSNSMRRLGYAAILFGAIMGGGVASGSSPAYYMANIMGWKGIFLFPLLVAFLFVCFYLGLEVARLYDCKHYDGLFKVLYGKTLSKVMAPLTTIALLYNYVACCGFAFAGAGGLAQTANLPGVVGGVVLAVICLFIMTRGKETYFKLDKYLSYMMIVVVVLVYTLGLVKGGMAGTVEKVQTQWTFDNGLSLWQSIVIEGGWLATYIGFIGVVMAVAIPLRGKKDNALICADCFLFQILGYILPGIVLLGFAPDCFGLALPMNAVINAIGFPALSGLYYVLYLAALITTVSVLAETIAQRYTNTKLLMKISHKESSQKLVIYVLVFGVGIFFSQFNLFGLTDILNRYSAWYMNILITIPLIVFAPIRIIQAKKQKAVEA